VKTKVEFYDKDWKMMSSVEIEGPPTLGRKQPRPAGAVHMAMYISVPISCCAYDWHEILRN